MGKTLGELADIARAAWMDCDLTGDHWAATAKAVRSKVIEDAIEAVRKIEDVTPADFKIGDGPFTKGDAWEAYYTGAIHTRTDLIKALKSATNDREAE